MDTRGAPLRRAAGLAWGPERPRGVLATAVIGDEYFSVWERYSLPSWLRYAERFEFAVLALTSSRLPLDVKPTWNKHLLPLAVQEEWGEQPPTIVMDADQVISPVAPDILQGYDAASIGVVSLSSNEPGESVSVRKLVSFMRRRFLSDDYPLDSAAVMGPAEIRARFQVPITPISAGLFVVPPGLAEALSGVLDLQGSDGSKVTGGGDQIPFNRWCATRPHHRLDRRWQAIWPDLMASEYPWMYLGSSRTAAAQAVAGSLMRNFCIHFATSWPEKQFWTLETLEQWDRLLDVGASDELARYLASDVTSREYGRISPPEHVWFTDDTLLNTEAGNPIT